MRKNVMLVLALGAALTVTIAAVAAAKFSVFQAGNLVLKADGGTSPKALPKKKFAPVNVNVKGKIQTKDGTHPPALREAIIDFDKNGKIDTKGLPACKGSALEARDTKAAKRVCGKTEVGKGQGEIEIAFPEQNPLKVKAPITVFNGGTKGGKTTLYIHTFITVPVPSAVVTTVTIKKVRKGRYGLSTVSKIPVIVGGSGSVLSFNIRFGKTYKYKKRKKSYIVARCTDGKFYAKVIKAIFKDEDGIDPNSGRTTLSGTVIRPCKSKG